MSPTRVKDIMTKNPVFISADSSLKEAAQEMEAANCGVLPVGTPDELEGIITDRDIVLRAVARGKDVNKEKVRDYMTPEVCSIKEDATPNVAANVMREKNINRVLVEDEDGRPSGILTFGRMIRENGNMEEIVTMIECAVGRKAA
jgi:CBS domain-containing protein